MSKKGFLNSGTGEKNLNYISPAKWTPEQVKQFTEVFNKASKVIDNTTFTEAELKTNLLAGCVSGTDKWDLWKNSFRYQIFPNANVNGEIKTAIMKMVISPDKWTICKQRYEF